MSRFFCLSVPLLLLCALSLPDASALSPGRSAKGNLRATPLQEEEYTAERAIKEAQRARDEAIDIENAAQLLLDAKKRVSAAAERAKVASGEADKLVEEMKKIGGTGVKLYTVAEATDRATQVSQYAKRLAEDAQDNDREIDDRLRDMKSILARTTSSYKTNLLPALKVVEDKQSNATSDEIRGVVSISGRVNHDVEQTRFHMSEVFIAVVAAEILAEEVEIQRNAVRAEKEKAEAATDDYKGPCPPSSNNEVYQTNTKRNGVFRLVDSTAFSLLSANKLVAEVEKKGKEAQAAVTFITEALSTASGDVKSVVEAQKVVAEAAVEAVKKESAALQERKVDLQSLKSFLEAMLTGNTMCKDTAEAEQSLKEAGERFEKSKEKFRAPYTPFRHAIFAAVRTVRAKNVTEKAVKSTEKKTGPDTENDAEKETTKTPENDAEKETTKTPENNAEKETTKTPENDAEKETGKTPKNDAEKDTGKNKDSATLGAGMHSGVICALLLLSMYLC